MTLPAGSGALTPGQRRALAAMPENKDAMFPRLRSTIPASHYVDPQRYDLERRQIYQHRPIVAGPALLLPKPGCYAQLDMLGLPVLLTRSAGGQFGAFVNVCRHRGARLCNASGTVEGSRLVCPYHAWSYQLDGSLFAIPRQETFPGIDKKEHGLTPLPALEAGGLLWIGLEPGGTLDFSAVRGEIEQDLDALGLAGRSIFERTTFEIRANWKLVMDSMLDSYHVTRLHKDSLARFFVDVENVIDCIGPHIRAAAARGNFTRSIPCDTFEAARQIMVFAYTLFPNGIIVVSPTFVSVGIVRPVATDRTAVDYFMLANAPPANERDGERLRRSFELMRQAFGREDYWAAEQCDAGLRSGALQAVQIGGMEIQIPMFHRFINECLGDLPGAL